MKKTILFICLVVVSEAFAQQSSKYFNVHWGQLYPVYDGAFNIIQLPDSTYFITAESNAQIPNSVVRHVIRINKNGVTFAQYSDSDLTFRRGIKGRIEPNLNINRLYSGTGLLWYDTNGVGRSVPYIYVFDTIGYFLTPLIVGDTANMKTGSIMSIAYTQNNFMLCSGGIGVLINGQLSLRAAYWKIDTLGNTIWERRDSSSTCCVNRFSSIKEDAGGNFIMLGWFNNQNNASIAERLWLRKIDTNGNTLWDYKYDEPDIDSTFNYAVLQARSLAIANDGNYMVSADYRATLLTNTSGRPSALIKFSAVDGHIIWRFNMVTIDTNYTYANAIEKIVPIPGEGYVLFGSLFDKRGDIAAFISKINENGQELWRKTFGTSVGQRSNYHDDYFFDGIQTLDGGFAAVGQTADSTFWVDAWLVKTNCNGDTAAPVANFSQTLNASNNTIATFTNLSLRYDTCVFNFGDGSPLVYKSYLDTVAFTHTFPNYATNYNVTCIAKSCNQEWDTTQTLIFTGIRLNNYEERVAFNIKPNPSNGSFIISASQATYNNVIIYSIDGKEVYNNKLVFTKGNANFDLDLPNGVYHVKLIGSSGVASQKLVISK